MYASEIDFYKLREDYENDFGKTLLESFFDDEEELDGASIETAT